MNLGRWCLFVGWAWLGLLAATAVPVLWLLGPGSLRDWWFASAAAALPLPRNLLKFAVATPLSPRKIPSVELEILRRMLLVLLFSLGLYLSLKPALGQQFWVGLVVWYQLALWLDTGLLVARWKLASSPAGLPPGVVQTGCPNV